MVVWLALPSYTMCNDPILVDLDNMLCKSNGCPYLHNDLELYECSWVIGMARPSIKKLAIDEMVLT